MLTSQAAYAFAAKEQPSKFERLHRNLILGFTPKLVNDDRSSWSAVILNYYFCLGMVKLNPAVGVCFMEEAGVSGDCIEMALDKAGSESINKYEYKVENTRVAIAPPTFSSDPSLWLERGYEVNHNLQPGDICVFENFVGFFQRNTEAGIYVVAGFYQNSVGSGVSEEKLIKVVRV